MILKEIGSPLGSAFRLAGRYDTRLQYAVEETNTNQSDMLLATDQLILQIVSRVRRFGLSESSSPWRKVEIQEKFTT
jgi:hypothetical protein